MRIRSDVSVARLASTSAYTHNAEIGLGIFHEQPKKAMPYSETSISRSGSPLNKSLTRSYHVTPPNIPRPPVRLPPAGVITRTPIHAACVPRIVIEALTSSMVPGASKLGWRACTPPETRAVQPDERCRGKHGVTSHYTADRNVETTYITSAGIRSERTY